MSDWSFRQEAFSELCREAERKESRRQKSEPDYSKLPEHVRGPIERYIESGLHPGSGLFTVLSRDLMAVCEVDAETLAVLPELLRWLYCEAPPGSWGSTERVRMWRGIGKAA